MRAAMSLTATEGATQLGHKGCKIYWANVLAVTAFPVGTKIKSATHKYKKAGSGPKASLI